MSVPFNFATAIEAALNQAAAQLGLDAAPFAPEVRTADARHGDFQANGVLPYAKRTKQNPRALAEQVVAALPASLTDAFEVAIAGPGFLNFTCRPATLESWLATYATEPSLREGASATQPESGQTFIVDYSSPNTAKQMHVGHLRSAVIGEAMCRLLEFGGAKVIRDNHIGDWGTGFGKLIWAYKRHLNADALAQDPLEEFERLYKLGNKTADEDESVLEDARQELVNLQSGNEENLAIWRHINEVSLAAFQKIYDQFGITFDHTLGESFYNDKVSQVYAELTDLGLAEISEGALVVFHPEHPRFSKQPFLIRKSDGAANYASTDLATILYRVEHFQADGVIYVIDSRQGDHCQQLFLTAEKWFAKTNRPLPRLEHTSFGTVLGENGKPLKTRSGENIKLRDLLAEATERAAQLVASKSANLPPAEQQAVAAIVGVGSVQYADLSQNRSSDYVFSWDKMISLEGNTAAYLLYAVARIHSIFRKLDTDPSAAAATAAATPLVTATEVTLARKLTKFPEALRATIGQLRPHTLCLYLYELAGEFSAFYNADKVAVDDAGVRARRLRLCARTLLILETGLNLLGLRTLKRM
ncbi:arginine--tRNA ligase [Synoicihabitans lomoniglobus]|uniref:Arginine--tRNA ligase n=1 Tax=Synoicihabitans lomoniglobus TaxID=2909285 RepID=A0AAF0CQE1_9BACT|nr:arginine--tRNA ligase [Opitutaceae bacterium LMO-M01]WED66138.1 arginine--tRNA ligase [Opitutaceae bacterium LMO-M01]